MGAIKHFGSCVGIWESPEMVSRRRYRQRDGAINLHNKLSVPCFAEVLRIHQCPVVIGERGEMHLWLLSVALGYYGSGSISRSGLEWLDAWEPSVWMIATPDEEAWNEFKATLLKAFGHLLGAWLLALDQD